MSWTYLFRVHDYHQLSPPSLASQFRLALPLPQAAFRALLHYWRFSSCSPSPSPHTPLLLISRVRRDRTAPSTSSLHAPSFRLDARSRSGRVPRAVDLGRVLFIPYSVCRVNTYCGRTSVFARLIGTVRVEKVVSCYTGCRGEIVIYRRGCR